ncbi:MAG: N-6 DNA methylase [Capsulimonadales bacterium]|nr:N-6 DNA methylase [Capsulimonadales bacterium]
MADRRQLGAFYTPDIVADFLADRMVRQDDERILEPSFGDGAFLRAILRRSAARRLSRVRLYGIEIDERTYAATPERTGGAGTELDLRCQDFLSLAPFPVDAALGNPPYVRLRNLPTEQRERAVEAARAVLGTPMDPSGSVWMPFVLHCLRFLARGGRMAFVLPYEMTYVRYARPLWTILGERFGRLTALRVRERIFPTILQEVLLLLADDYGTSGGSVAFRAYDTVRDLLAERPVRTEDIPTGKIAEGRRVFSQALLAPELRVLLNGRLRERTEPIRRQVRFHTGYVTGDKRFFHPSDDDIRQFDLPERHLYPTLTETRSLKGAGLSTSTLSERKQARLFLPDPTDLTDGERDYVSLGEENGVSERYKCRIRVPWFVVPGIRVPDIVLSVFSERPVLMTNNARLLASNSLLCGFLLAGNGNELAARWYTSLTLLQCEIEVHALGGGVLVLIPGETGNIRVPARIECDPVHLETIDRALRAGAISLAYGAGDRAVLERQLGLSPAETDLIREGVATLTAWRTASRTGRRDSEAEV